MKEKILENLGLNKNEISIYLFLLNNGKANISEISKITGLSRPVIYNTLPNMLENELVIEILKGKRKYYSAGNPKVLKGYLSNIQKNFDFIYQELEESYKKTKNKVMFQNLRGRKGIKYIFGDIVKTLDKGGIFYRYSSRKSQYIKGYLPDFYRKLRDEKQLMRYVITNNIDKKKKLNKPLKEVVELPKNTELFEDDILKIIYKDRVAIIDYNSNQGFIIKNQEFANFERKTFKLLFKFLKK